MPDLVLPAFEMDCREWVVVDPAEAGLPEEVAGAPVVAVMSTVVLDHGTFAPASGVFTLGLLDEDAPPSRPVADSVAAELIDSEQPEQSRRYVLPAPGTSLALLAEFNLPGGPEPAVLGRIESLMSSFRWAA
jgi:hypothetical protein